ncbi:U-box domain [Dillenia turbinata]|uniref:U-box domain-containing protein n=1 Tax=Dillenia turbinata TaxID=194707 RepID=A0AAN8V504_9MAGN
MKESEEQIPHLFRCPISLDLFTDPVTLCTGQTYDRPSIEKWLSSGNSTCPVTMQRLHDLSLIPNYTLRHLINQWLNLRHQFDLDPSVVEIKHNLVSQETTFDIKIQSLEKIRSFTHLKPGMNPCLVQLGFFQLLLELIFVNPIELESMKSRDFLKFVEDALFCVTALLPFSELGFLNFLKEESKFESFLILFELGNDSIKMCMCDLVEAISTCEETKELCIQIGKNRKCLQELIHLKTESSLKIILRLCSCSESNPPTLIREGVVQHLVSYIMNNIEKRGRNSLLSEAMSAIDLMLRTESGRECLMEDTNGINAIVRMVFRMCDHEGSESAVDSLMILCQHSLQAREEAICGGVLTQLLLLLQSQCSGSVKTKARMLLKLLRSTRDEATKHGKTM